MSLKIKLWLLAAIAVAAIVGPRVWKRIPPFERGIHDEQVDAAVVPGTADSPHIGPCPMFPADNVWNTPIDKMPVDASSAAYLGSIGDSKLHPDFGSNLLSGIPYTVISPRTKRVPITFRYRADSDLANYPIPPDAPIEGGAAAAVGDRHILLVDSGRCLLWEIFSARALPDGTWNAGAGVRIDMTGNGLRGEGKSSADAAGMPILPGLVRYDEVQAGAINHALRFTVPHTRSTYIWPARHSASRNADPNLPPLGARFRLRADFDISHFSKPNQVILKALKRYGMFLADNGGGIFISGVGDKRWDDDDLHKLGAVKATDFEVVNESEFIMMPDSGRVDPLAVRR